MAAAVPLALQPGPGQLADAQQALQAQVLELPEEQLWAPQQERAQ